MTVYWPRGILVPRHAHINPAPATVAGVAALSGFRQAVASPAAVWSIAYDAIRVGQDQRLVWRALAAQIEGRASPIVLPIYDRADMRPLGASVALTAPHGDNAAHDDNAPYVSRRSQVLAAGAAARGASRLTATTILGAALEPGQHFSIGHRLYRIKAIEAVVGASTTVTFWPTAREAILAGAELEFDEPVCKVRLAEDSGMDLALDTGRHAFPSVAFIEDPS